MASPPSPDWTLSPSWIPNPNAPGYGESRGSVAIAACVIFSIISLATLSARLFARSRIVCNVGIDDYIIICSWLFASTFTALVIIQVSRGLGRHAWNMTFAQNASIGCPFWASVCFYHLSLTFTKISIIIQYLRIFVAKKIRVACWLALAGVTIYGAWAVLSSIFLCTPISYFWDKSMPGGYCLPQVSVRFSNAALNIATDMAILVLPMPALSQLKLPKRQKIALMMVLGLGGVVCVVSMLRFRSLYIVSTTQDISWENAITATWTSAENNFGIMCACLPTCRPLLGRWIPFLNQTRVVGSGTGNSQSQCFNNSSRSRDKHTILTDATGPSFSMSRISKSSPSKAVAHPSKRQSEDDPENNIEAGRIKVVTIIEQEMGNEAIAEDSSQRYLVW